LGLKFADRQITGSTARCFAMLDAFTAFIKDYKVAPDKVIPNYFITSFYFPRFL
jgi:hypothetical protein